MISYKRSINGQPMSFSVCHIFVDDPQDEVGHAAPLVVHPVRPGIE